MIPTLDADQAIAILLITVALTVHIAYTVRLNRKRKDKR